MSRSDVSVSRGLATVLLATCVTLPLAGGQGGDANLDRVISTLQKRQEQAGRVRIRAEGTRLIPKGGRSDNFPRLPDDPPGPPIQPPADELTELKQDFTIDYPTGRYRRLYQERLAGRLDSWIQVYDGVKGYGSKLDIPIDEMAGIQPAHMTIATGSQKNNIYHSAWWPYFMVHGYILTATTGRPYWMHDVRVPIDRENLHWVRSEAFRGQPCDVIRTFPDGPKKAGRFFEFVIGREDGAPRRMTDWFNGEKNIEITIDYRKAGGRSVPTEWVNEWYGQKTRRPWQTEKMTVKVCEFEAVAGEEPFKPLVPKAGGIVKDWQISTDSKNPSKTRMFQADENGRLIEGDVVNGQFVPRKRFLWWWVAGGLCVLLTAVVLVSRRVRRGVRPPQATAPPEISGGSP